MTTGHDNAMATLEVVDTQTKAIGAAGEAIGANTTAIRMLHDRIMGIESRESARIASPVAWFALVLALLACLLALLL